MRNQFIWLILLLINVTLFAAGAVEQVIDFGVSEMPFSPVIGDVDGDGWPEIVISSRNSSSSYTNNTGKIRVVRIEEDGTVTTLWNRTYGRSCFTPAIADVDQNGTSEIYLNIYFNSPGNMGIACIDAVTGDIIWQNDLGSAAYTGVAGHELLLADFDGDGDIEVISQQNHTGSDYFIIVLDALTGVEEFRIDTGSKRAYASMCCEDINNDGANELISAVSAGSSGDVEVVVWDNTRTELWRGVGGPPAIADVDLDGEPEIVVGYVEVAGSGSYPYHVIIYSFDGEVEDTIFVEESKSTYYTHYECPVIADFDPISPGPEVAVAVNHVLNPAHPTSSSYCRVTVIRLDHTHVWQTPFFDEGEIISMSGADLNCDEICDLCSYNMAGGFIVFDGADGDFWAEFWDFDGSPDPDPNRFVAVADMDNDCHAEFAVSTYRGSTSDSKCVYIYGDDFNWNPVRRSWNTGSYYYTNVDDSLYLDSYWVSNKHWEVDNIWRAQRVISCGLEIIPGPILSDGRIVCAGCDTIGELSFDVTYWNPTCETIAWGAMGILEWTINSDCVNYIVGQDTTMLGDLEPESDTVISYTLEIDPDCDSLEIYFWLHLTCINSLYLDNRHMESSTWTPFCGNRPIAQLVRPSESGRIISCGPSDTTGIVWTETGQDIIFNVSGDSITSSSYELDTLAMTFHIESIFSTAEDITMIDPRLTYDGDSCSGGLFFQPDPMYPHGDTVVFWLTNIVNGLGCDAETVPCTMIIDDRPPDTTDVNPNLGELVNFTMLNDVYAVMEDDFMNIESASVFAESTSVTINGIPVAGYNVDLHFDNTDPDTMFFEGITADVYPGDTVEICLWAMIDDVRDTMFCGPNRTPRTCWFFIITAEEPVARLVHPDPNTYSACEDQQIIIEIISEAPMDTTTMQLEIDTVIHTIYEDELYWDTDSNWLVWSPPVGWWQHGNRANVILDRAEDVLGQNYANYPLAFDFWLDFEEPLADFLNPPMGANQWVRDRATNIVIRIDEDLSGLDVNSVGFWIDDDPIGLPPATLIEIEPGRWDLTYNPEIAGNLYTPGDTIVVTFRACDSPDYCDPNCGTYADSFIVEPEVACLVFPNPFTPNGDDINRFAVFNFPHMFTTPGELVIFNVRNREVFRDEIGPVIDATELFQRKWDGVDSDGNLLPEGLYLYVIKQEGQIICNGTVILAR